MMQTGRQRYSFRCIFLLGVLAAIGGCGSGSSWDTKPDQHYVRRGETLYSIAWRYGENPADVARWNQLGDGSLIHPGDTIRLTPPSGGGASRLSRLSRRRPGAGQQKARSMSNSVENRGPEPVF
jgi:lipoprotein NlpD